MNKVFMAVVAALVPILSGCPTETPTTKPTSASVPSTSPAGAWKKDTPLPAVRIADRTAEPLLKADKPWEAFCVNYCRVIRTGQGWHMWYNSYDASYKDDGDSYLCYARSKDGLRWEKPNLGLFEYAGSKENNILAYGVCGAGVFLDENAPPAERFKIVYIKSSGGEWWVHGGTSADGLRWKWLPEPLLKKNSDTDTVCIVEGGRYRLYVRMWIGGRRAVGYTESDSFGKFPDPVVILEPDSKDPSDLHFYNSAATKLLDGLYLMLPSGFYTSQQIVRPHAALGRDGKTFDRVGREPIIETGKGFDSRCVYVAAGGIPADKPGEYWFYYLGNAVEHDGYWPGKVKYAGGIGRFRLILSEQPAIKPSTASRPIEWQKTASGLESRLESEVWNKGEAIRFRIIVRNRTDNDIKVGGFKYDGAVTLDGDVYQFAVRPMLSPEAVEKLQPVIKAGWSGEFGTWYHPIRDSFTDFQRLERRVGDKWVKPDLKPGRHTAAFELGPIKTGTIEFDLPAPSATQPESTMPTATSQTK